ncbi:MAG TPA: VCBS repeat-containing protein, partial [Planctomycetota bacterium]|nr:VCBS repeat-containing protein [Planctomycetota bacterium]
MRALPILLLAGLASLPAQQVLQSMSYLDFYWNFTPMGDVNGDGYEDVMVTSKVYVGPWPNFDDYELRVYSGKDASLIRLGPRTPYPDYILSFPHGDQDHDGVRDYVCWERNSATNIQMLSVRSGRDDHVLWAVQQPTGMYWAYHVIGDLDLDGDGELDVVVSHPVAASQGVIWAYDHQGNLLYQRTGAPPPYTLAQSLAKLGDVNGDGCDDFLCGLGDPYWYGAVGVISGRTGRLMRIVTGQNFLDYIGSACVGCGDLDGDGVPDFAAGGGLSGANGSVQAFSGATGNRLFSVYSGGTGDNFGAVLQAGDYDHDGVLDIIAPTWLGLRVVSGREGVQIAHYAPAPGIQATFGRALALKTPSGFPRLLLRSQAPACFLMTTQPRHSEVLGPGCAIAGPAHPSPRLGMRELSTLDRRLTLSGAEPGSLAFLMLGLASASSGPIGLAPIGLPWCSLYPSLQVIGGFTTGSSPSDAGFARHDFTVPSPTAFGLGIDAQWLTLDTNSAPAGLTAG